MVNAKSIVGVTKIHKSHTRLHYNAIQSSGLSAMPVHTCSIVRWVISNVETGVHTVLEEVYAGRTIVCIVTTEVLQVTTE